MSDSLKRSRQNVLLLKVAEGDEQAFSEFFYLYHSKVYTYCLTLVKDHHLAEEVVQEVMLKIWSMGTELRHILNPDALIRTIARNRVIDILRSESSRLRINEVVRSETSDFNNDNDEHIHFVDMRRILDEAISSLPQQQQAAYILAEKDDLNGPEIAERMGLSLATVHTHLKLAKRKIRSYIKRHGDLSILISIVTII